MIVKDEVSFGVTGFIDILGFANKILLSENIQDVQNLKSELIDIQKEFQFNTKDEVVKESHKLSNTTVLAFSDSIIINIPFESEATEFDGLFDPIVGDISALAYAQANCVLKSVFVRGGIDLGWWYHKDSFLLSKSLTNAYKLENKANVPVIAISNEFYDYLKTHEGRKCYSPETDPIRTCFRNYSEGDVSFWYIDYISICIESLSSYTSHDHFEECKAANKESKEALRLSGYRENVNQWFIEHSEKIINAYANVEDEKIKRKYIWLSEYHNEMVNKYACNPECLCNLL